jgi:hypothetical protein
MGEPECCERRCSILVRSMVLDAGRFVPSLAARIVTSSCDSTRCDASLRVRVVDSPLSVCRVCVVCHVVCVSYQRWAVPEGWRDA